MLSAWTDPAPPGSNLWLNLWLLIKARPWFISTLPSRGALIQIKEASRGPQGPPGVPRGPQGPSGALRGPQASLT